MNLDTSTPVLILGGKENSLSLTRSLGRLGIKVKVSGPLNALGQFSRYCEQRYTVPYGVSSGEYWGKLLLSESHEFDGFIILECSDEAIEFVANNKVALEKRYVLCEGDSVQKQNLLDKKKTLEMARDGGLSTPDYWTIESQADLKELKHSFTFPVMVKPIHSHKFVEVFKRKLFIIEEDYFDLERKVTLALENGIEVMVVEMVPGPDDLLSSYYTYIDSQANSLFDYTKRVLRRYPVNRGPACYHVTEWLPETAEVGKKFFESIGFKGIGNIEFKRDTRDGKLKVIEVNARFTAGQELVRRSGAPLDAIVYANLTKQSVPTFSSYKQNMHYWYPVSDFFAFLELRKKRKMSILGWIKSVVSKQKVYPLWKTTDPLPSMIAGLFYIPVQLRKYLKRPI